MIGLSITQPVFTVLRVQQHSVQNIVIPAANSKKIHVVPLTKVLSRSCDVPKACFDCKAMRWNAENEISKTGFSDGTVRLDANQDSF